jgi:hypothetical protein
MPSKVALPFASLTASDHLRKLSEERELSRRERIKIAVFVEDELTLLKEQQAIYIRRIQKLESELAAHIERWPMQRRVLITVCVALIVMLAAVTWGRHV